MKPKIERVTGASVDLGVVVLGGVAGVFGLDGGVLRCVGIVLGGFDLVGGVVL